MRIRQAEASMTAMLSEPPIPSRRGVTSEGWRHGDYNEPCMSGVGRTYLRVGLDSIKMSAQGRLKCPSALGGGVNFRMLSLSPVANQDVNC